MGCKVLQIANHSVCDAGNYNAKCEARRELHLWYFYAGRIPDYSIGVTWRLRPWIRSYTPGTWYCEYQIWGQSSRYGVVLYDFLQSAHLVLFCVPACSWRNWRSTDTVEPGRFTWYCIWDSVNSPSTTRITMESRTKTNEKWPSYTNISVIHHPCVCHWVGTSEIRQLHFWFLPVVSMHNDAYPPLYWSVIWLGAKAEKI